MTTKSYKIHEKSLVSCRVNSCRVFRVRVEILHTIDDPGIKFLENEKSHFYFVYSNKAHDDGFGELSWAQKARSKL